MCGIAGILTSESRPHDWRPRAAAMQAALAHRGPDDRGDWTSPGGHATFAHARLAVIEPSPIGRQPMTVDGRLTIVLNGEIYNFKELRRELERKGMVFRTRTDTEVVLRAYDQFGPACVERLRGMFAFALWDEAAQQCLLARDRFGIKPLYLAHEHGRLVFASELRAVLASGLVSSVIDTKAVYDYFRSGSVQEPRTLVAAARVLEAGHVAIWRGGRVTTRKYWDLSFAPDLQPSEAVPATRAALIDSLQHHFVSDVPVGIFLSGGVDSTALLALARAYGHREVRALTMSLPGQGDELATARRTAQHFGVAHEVCTIDAAAGKALFADYLHAMDQPSIDGMNTLAVAKLARASGIKVMLSGVGADELFGGYPSVHAVPRLAAWNRRLAATGVVRALAGRLLQRMPDARWRRVGDMLGQEPGVATSYAAFRGIFTRAEARRLTREYTGSAPPLDDADDPADDDPTPQDAACRLEMTRYLRNQLLRDADVMSMACGVEIRVPFVDTIVVDTVTRIAQRDRLSLTKDLLLSAVPEIPEWVARQPKRGFMFPIEEWLRGPWAGAFAAVEAKSPVAPGAWYRKWCIRAFTEWLERRPEPHYVHEPAPALIARSTHD